MSETTETMRSHAFDYGIGSGAEREFIHDADRLAKLEDGIRALSQTIEAESDRHQQSWRNGASLHYEGRADQAADDADRLRTLLQE